MGFLSFGSDACLPFTRCLPPERGNISDNPSELLQGTGTRSRSSAAIYPVYPGTHPPLHSKPWSLKPTYRLESISGEHEFVLAADAIPLNSGSNLLQHIQPERDKRKGKKIFFPKSKSSPVRKKNDPGKEGKTASLRRLRTCVHPRTHC